jgi:hypothetical protein
MRRGYTALIQRFGNTSLGPRAAFYKLKDDRKDLVSKCFSGLLTGGVPMRERFDGARSKVGTPDRIHRDFRPLAIIGSYRIT